MRNVLTGKNILGTTGSFSDILGTNGTTSGKNVHLQYTTPDLGIDQTIAKALVQYSGGAFGLDVNGYIIYTERGITQVDRISIHLAYITSGLRILGVNQLDDRIQVRDIVKGVELYVPSTAENVSYSLTIKAWPIIGTVSLEYDKLVPGRVVTLLE